MASESIWEICDVPLLLVLVVGALATPALGFAIASAQWKAETDLAPEGRPHTRWLDLAVNDRGEAIVVWVGCDGPPTAIAPPAVAEPACPELRGAARSTRGDWQPIRPLLREGVALPRVVLDGNGSALAVWLAGPWRSPRGLFTAVKARNRLGWSTPRDLADGCGSIGRFELAHTARGGAVVAWQCDTGIWARIRSAETRTWGKPRRLARLVAASDFDVALDGRGNALAAWVRCPAIRNCLVESTRYLTASRSWEGRRRMHSGGEIPEVEVGASGSGTVLVAWVRRQPPGDPGTLEAAVGQTGRPWTTPQVIRRGSQPGYLGWVVVASSRNGFAAVWRNGDAVEARALARNGRWGRPRLLSTSRMGGLPRLTGDDRDRFIAVWPRSVIGTGVAAGVAIEAAASSPAGVWGERETVATGQRLVDSLDIEAWGNQRALAAWISVDGEAPLPRLVRIAAR